MIDQYVGIVEYYDLLVTSGYYKYDDRAEEIHSIVGNNCEVLELGVGTGLLAESYIKIDPDCRFTGIDSSASMLKIANNRLGNKVSLIEVDAVTMDLNAMFDVAISNGGVWGILDWGDRWEFGGHISGLKANCQGLNNLGRHLREEGLLLLHLQKPHKNYEQHLSDGIMYSQFIEEVKDCEDYHTFQKSYFFKKNGKILAQEQIMITCFKPDISRKILSNTGFSYQSTSNGGHFAIYKRR